MCQPSLCVVKTRIYRFCSSNCIKCSLKDTCASTTALTAVLSFQSQRSVAMFRAFIDTSACRISCTRLCSINKLIKIRFFRDCIIRRAFTANFIDVNVLLTLKRFQSSRFCLFKARRKFIPHYLSFRIHY